MTRNSRAPAVVVALFLGGGLLAACSSAPEPAPTSPSATAPEGLGAELLRYRRDEAMHRVQVKVVNAGDTDVVVSGLSLTLPGFEGVAEREHRSVVGAGSRVDLPVEYGAAECDGARPVDASGPARVVLDLEGGPVTLDVSDDAGLRARLATSECAQRAASEAAPMAFSGWAASGDGDALVATGTLSVGPVAGDVVLARLDGTTLFSVRTDLPLPAPVEGTLEVPVVVEPARCDPHAVAESKRAYDVRVGVSVAGAEPVLVTVPVPEADRGVLEDVLARRCHLG